MEGKRYGMDRIWKGEVENKNKGALWFPTFFLCSRPIRPKPSAFKKCQNTAPTPLTRADEGEGNCWHETSLFPMQFFAHQNLPYTLPRPKKRKKNSAIFHPVSRLFGGARPLSWWLWRRNKKAKGISIFVSCGSGFCQVSLSWYLSICGIGGWQEDVWSQCSIEHGSKRSKFSQRSSRFFLGLGGALAGNTLAHLCLILYMEVNSSIFGWDRWGEPRWGGSIKIGRGLRVDIHFHAPCWGGERRVK